eukprot:Sspe_Gene.3394::Locus_1113_Transcript_1_1_Confidence_1.000_Length_1112::g.3394::m.3394/K12405/HSD17B4; 3-hydroxyacyl-CoA dehydrogenase / 3a,7a,12a-trihydroxy-5b-cholest-24-enoyl-CoA hydratase / enoyl-CoA hydratase 2
MPMDVSKYLNQWAEQEVAYTRRDLLIYALGIGCSELRYIYEKDRKFAAFPTYPVIFPFKGTDNDVLTFPSEAMKKGAKKPGLPGVKVVLDGEKLLESFHPIPVGAKLRIKERLIGVHKRGSGAAMETEMLVTDLSGDKVYSRLISGAFFVGANDFTDAGVSYSEKVDLPKRPCDSTASYTTAANQAELYRLSGDYNPLHVDPKFAKAMGFKKPILHGLCSFGISARLVLNQYAGGDDKRFKAIKVRFSKPVLPGQTLEVEMWQESPEKIIFQTRIKETGEVCVNNAYMLLHPASPGAKL